MHNKQLITFLLSCCLVLFQRVSAQEVWPGDINNNGVVNGVDLLYYGVAFGSTGPQRGGVATDWEAKPFPGPWSQSFPDGTNYAFADCDGSGIVDEDDFDDAIEDNFGLTHGPLFPDGYANGQPGASPRIRLQPDADLVGEGATVNISLSLDDSDGPLAGFYGMSLKLGYNTELLAGDDGLDFELAEDNWIGRDNSLVQDIFVDNDEQGRADFAITRTNQQTITVQPDAIGNISIVIEDIIVGLMIDTVRIWVDSIRLIDSDFNTIPVVPDTARIIVAKDPTLVSTRNRNTEPRIQLFPNPAKGTFFIKSDVPLSELQLTDGLGRSIPLQIGRIKNSLYQVKDPRLPPGIYYLHSRTPTGIVTRKILFSP